MERVSSDEEAEKQDGNWEFLCAVFFLSCTHVVGCGGGDVCGSVIEHQTCDRKVAGLIPTQETGIKWRNVWV